MASSKHALAIQSVPLRPGGYILAYTIKRVELSSVPRTNWFWSVKQKHFDHDPVMRGIALEEPGLPLGWK